MLLNLLSILLLSAGVLIVGVLFVVAVIFGITFIRLIWASCNKAVQEFKNNKEKH